MKVDVTIWRNLSSRDKQHLIEVAVNTNNIKLFLAKKRR